MIIAAFAGTGKTTLASLYPQKVVDFICMPYKYYLDKNEVDDEACKANSDYVLHNDWPYNYVQAIKQNLDNDKILLIPPDIYVLLLLRGEGLPYTICYPEKEAKEIYRNRFIARGNTEEFIDIFIGGWDKFIDSLENDRYGKHIILEADQYLSDVVEV